MDGWLGICNTYSVNSYGNKLDSKNDHFGSGLFTNDVINLKHQGACQKLMIGWHKHQGVSETPKNADVICEWPLMGHFTLTAPIRRYHSPHIVKCYSNYSLSRHLKDQYYNTLENWLASDQRNYFLFDVITASLLRLYEGIIVNLYSWAAELWPGHQRRSSGFIASAGTVKICEGMTKKF